MLVVRTPEDRADALGNLVSAQKPLGFHHLALAMNPLGSIALSHGLLVGKKQLMILTPSTISPFFTFLLYSLIQVRTSLLTCQGALSRIKTHTFLPLS